MIERFICESGKIPELLRAYERTRVVPVGEDDALADAGWLTRLRLAGRLQLLDRVGGLGWQRRA